MITRQDHGYRLETELTLPQPRDEVFPFFAEARNLEELTPSFLQFEVLTPAPIEMREGVEIDYRLKVRGIPIRWRSRITVWEPPHRFMDVQVKGPYRRWEHQHLFEQHQGQTVCRDIVDYDVYGGALIHAMFVKSDVQKIFEYRQQVLRDRFAGRGMEPVETSMPCSS